jgi:sterol desaturase/sphingolipid hydroxylase (fatty acid hydroxylase superfamily)
MSFSEIVELLKTPLSYFTSPSNRTFWLYLATSFILAILLQKSSLPEPDGAKGNLFKRLFPRTVYTHRSAIVDYIYFVTNTVLYAFILAPFFVLAPSVSHWIVTGLSTVCEPSELVLATPLVATVVVTVVMTLVADFATFLAHYLMHKIPALWEFHKVHHSAEVMTPMTVYRMHPLDDIFTVVVGGVLVGLADGLIRFFVTPAPSQQLLYGLGLVTFLFYVFGYNLRHSHIWVSYGRTVSKFLISPAQHQIHHSVALRHWDKNFGFVFAIWDWMFGSLYVPHGYEKLEFGLGTGEEKEYSSPLRLYLLPFVKVGGRWLSKISNVRPRGGRIKDGPN